jgi:Arc/MetJ-type ribon-helix-helix transcriptional regulator
MKVKVQSGEYALEGEMIKDGLQILLAQDRDIESWLQSTVGSAYDALKLDPSRAVTANQVRERLATEHAKKL